MSLGVSCEPARSFQIGSARFRLRGEPVRMAIPIIIPRNLKFKTDTLDDVITTTQLPKVSVVKTCAKRPLRAVHQRPEKVTLLKVVTK